MEHLDPMLNRMIPDMLPVRSFMNLKTEGQEKGRTSNIEKQKAEVNLANLVMSMDDIKRLFLIMLPGKVVIPEQKGQIIDITS